MKKRGCELVQVVEHWNPFAHIRQDLFGIVDILCIRGSDTIAVQATSGTNVSARVNKMKDSDALLSLQCAGWKVLVHGWRKVKVKRGGKAVRWELREVNLSKNELLEGL